MVDMVEVGLRDSKPHLILHLPSHAMDPRAALVFLGL